MPPSTTLPTRAEDNGHNDEDSSAAASGEANHGHTRLPVAPLSLEKHDNDSNDTAAAPLSAQQQQQQQPQYATTPTPPPPPLPLPPAAALTRDYITGLVFIVLVSVIWAASSVLIQYIYGIDDGDGDGDNKNDNNKNDDDQHDQQHHHFHSPFAVTYIGVSLFALFLPVHACFERISRIRRKQPLSTTAAVQYQSLPEHSSSAGGDGDYGDYEDDDYEEDDDVLPPDDDDDNLSLTAENNNHNAAAVWTHRDHCRAACQIAPVWFVANWTYNASLAYTSITSSTVLASTGSLFTFLLAVHLKDEHFSVLKCCGVVLGVLGSGLTAWHDHRAAEHGGTASTNTTSSDQQQLEQSSSVFDYYEDAEEDDDNNTLRRIRWLLLTATTTSSQDNVHSSLWGDLLGLLSAMGYAAYAVQTRVLCPKDDGESRYSMQLLLGYIGLLNGAALAPVVLFRLATGRLRVPVSIFGYLVVKGLFDNVLSDYLWLRAVMLTNATVATVGLGLTIPLAFGGDVLLGKSGAAGVMSAGQVLGALAVLVGFVLVNVGNRDDMVEAAAHHHHHQHRNDHAVVVAAAGEDDNDELRRHEPYSDESSEHGQEVVTLRNVT